MLLNIIHPYTYKFNGDTLDIGPCPEFRERDEKVRNFIRKSFDVGANVILHNYSEGSCIGDGLRDAAFLTDPLFDFLFDERIKEVKTTIHGLPRFDKKPKGFPRREWEIFSKIYISHLEFSKLIGREKNVFFIGGVLENCVANIMNYFYENHIRNGERLFYIPELCVSVDPKKWEEIDMEKKTKGVVSTISYERVMDLISLV